MAKRTLVTPSSAQFTVQALRQGTGPLTLDIETNTLNQHQDDAAICGIGVYDPDLDSSWYFPFKHLLTKNLELSWLEELGAGIAHRDHIWHNCFFDIEFLMEHCPGGWSYPPTHDTMIIRRQVNFKQPAKLKLILLEYGWNVIEIDEIVNFKKGETMADIPASAVVPYVSQDVEGAWAIFEKEHPRLKEETTLQIYNLEMKVALFTIVMEMNGTLWDRDRLQDLWDQYEDLRLDRQTIVWGKFQELLGCGAGTTCTFGCTEALKMCEFPIHSTQKLSDMMYGRLNVPTDGIRATKKGYSTDADSMVKSMQRTGYSWIQDILDYKEAVTGRGRIQRLMSDQKDNGKIYTNLIQTHVISGRYASSKPNLQQINKDRRGKETQIKGMRKAMVPSPGYQFLELDQSQVEMRIFAVLAKAQQLIDAFNAGEDIHRRTASMTFKLDLDKITKEQRSRAKAVGFGAIFGQTPVGLARKEKMTEAEAERVHEAFFSAIPEFMRFVNQTNQFCRKYKGVYTQFGRWIPIPDVDSKNRYTRAKALRLSVNARIQGSAADTLKIAMAKLFKHLDEQGYLWNTIRPVLTVHDSILFEVSLDLDIKEVAKELMPLMELDFGPLRLMVDAEAGPDWGSMVKLFDEGPKIKEVTYDIAINVNNAKEDGLISDIADLFAALQSETDEGLIIILKGTGTDSQVPGKYDPKIKDYFRRLTKTKDIFEIR